MKPKVQLFKYLNKKLLRIQVNSV